MTASLVASARRIAPLAWPVVLGQVAVLAFSTVDTMVVARHSAADLAALASGAATYISVFVGLMGVALRGRLAAPSRPAIAALLRLGVPMGGSIMIEVTGFTFMAFFIARLGATPVAGHQIAVNIVSLMFMLALAIANASSTPLVICVLALWGVGIGGGYGLAFGVLGAAPAALRGVVGF